VVAPPTSPGRRVYGVGGDWRGGSWGGFFLGGGVMVAGEGLPGCFCFGFFSFFMNWKSTHVPRFTHVVSLRIGFCVPFPSPER